MNGPNKMSYCLLFPFLHSDGGAVKVVKVISAGVGGYSNGGWNSGYGNDGWSNGWE